MIARMSGCFRSLLLLVPYFRPLGNERIVNTPNDHILARLMAIIEERKQNPPEKSYTTSLHKGGLAKIGGKITEEAREVVEAAAEEGEPGRQHLVYEAGDLIYHLFVMLAWRDIPLAEVEAELARRFGVSGIDEKAARPPKENEKPNGSA